MNMNTNHVAKVTLTYATRIETFIAPQDVLDDLRSDKSLVRLDEAGEVYVNTACSSEGHEHLVRAEVTPLSIVSNALI